MTGTLEQRKEMTGPVVRTNRAKGAYSHLLTGALANYVEEQLDTPVEDQNSIQEELALLRAGASRAVANFNLAMEKKDEKTIYVCAQMMKKELQAVSNMASIASQIQAKSTDQMTRASVEVIISTIIDIIFGALRGESNGLLIAAAIEQEIQSKVRLNLDRGTTVLPSDSIVQMMDSTIPPENAVAAEE